MNTRVDRALVAGNRKLLATYGATHFAWACEAGVGTVTLNRPERKNPLTFESYAELRDLFRALKYASDVHAVVIVGAGDNFCSGGDVPEIIGPLVHLQAPELLMFTRMTGDLVNAMRACPQPIIAAVDVNPSITNFCQLLVCASQYNHTAAGDSVSCTLKSWES